MTTSVTKQNFFVFVRRTLSPIALRDFAHPSVWIGWTGWKESGDWLLVRNYQSMDNTLVLIQTHTRIATTPHYYAVASLLHYTTKNSVESTNDDNNNEWFS